jgi:hypothetical protein
MRPLLATLLFIAACAPAAVDDQQDTSGAGDELDHFGLVDQAGVVEAATMQLGGLPTDLLLGQYNNEDPFAINPAPYRDKFVERLNQFDAYDAESDWSADQIAQWTTRMSTGNYLVFDLSKPCDYYQPHTYLEIERNQMDGLDYETCGGRMPNEDALDVTLNFLVRGPAGDVADLVALHDGVDQATKPSSDTFPYLAELN